MLNVATTRAMPAKASSIIEKRSMKSAPMASFCSAVSSGCVSASMRAGSSSVISWRSVSWLTPSSAATSTAEMVSGRGANRSVAWASVNAV